MGATEEEDEEGALLEAAEASSNVTDGEEEEVGSRPFDYNLWVALPCLAATLPRVVSMKAMKSVAMKTAMKRMLRLA